MRDIKVVVTEWCCWSCLYKIIMAGCAERVGCDQAVALYPDARTMNWVRWTANTNPTGKGNVLDVIKGAVY